MKISVIIPSYKPQDYIYECIDSLNKQTLPKDLWEVIIILNGCNEPWYTLLKDYILSHELPNVILIQTDEGGVSNARNIGLDNARGEYITFIDDDDYVSPSYLEELSHIVSPDTIAASYTIAFDESHSFIPYYVESAYRSSAPKGIVPYYIARKYFSGPCMKLIHRSIIGDRRFNIHFRNGEDSLFMFEISNRMLYIVFTPTNAVYYRRIRKGSASNKNNWFQTLWNGMRLIGRYNNIYWRGEGYSFKFFCTRILGVINTLLTK